MVFRWDARDTNNPVWSQAMSDDNGNTWEWELVYVHEQAGIKQMFNDQFSRKSISLQVATTSAKKTQVIILTLPIQFIF